MKKLLLSTILIISIVTLSSCGTKKSNNNWLAGSWHSKDWNVTYVFSRTESTWNIKTKDGTEIANKATLSKDSSDKNSIKLVDKSGTQFIINKINNSHIKFYQTSKSGLLGTTAQVDFMKQ